MTFSFSRMDIYRLVLLCSVPVLLVSQTASAGKSSRRFIGLPESGERVKYSDASDKNKTLIIRHNLPGRIIFHESREFWIELLTTTPEEQNNSHVKISYTAIDNNDTILLQVYEPSLPEPADTSETDKLLVIILSSVGLFAVLGLVVSALCYFCYWKKRRKPVLKKQASKQLFEENATAETPTVSRAGRGGGTPGPSGTQFLVVAVCACALHAQLQTTNVEINVYFPKGFLRSDSKVFFKSENNNEVRVITNDTKLKINVFDVPNAGLVSENRYSDRNLTCANGACDPLAGKCVCPRKMRAIRQTGGGTRCVYRCDQKCQSGSFVLSSCNHTHQAVCKKCRPQCSFKEFESVPCAGKTDRNCTDISKLPQIKGSPNIIYEDILKVKDSPPVKKIIDNLSSHSTVWLNRSSGLAIQLQILLADFSTTFREVHHVANDNSGLKNDAPSQSIVRDFCGSPVPDYYRINLQQSAVDVQIIKGQPNTPCPRYDGGSTSNIPVPGNSLSCNGAENPMVRLFGVKSETEDFWKEEPSQACYDLKQNCHQCRNECTVLARENPICNLTKNDVRVDSRQNYGEHFTYCFDCCFQENCTCSSCACSQYNSSCIDSQLTCVGAKHFTIPITPVFPNTGLFKCHVKLSKGPVFELETALWKDGKLLRRIERNDMNFRKEAGRGKTSYDYGYMIFKQPSVLRNNMRKNILINGKAGKSHFDVGWYKTEQELENPIPVNTLSIQPTEPFKINTKDWPRENCQTLDTEKFVTISPNASIDNVENFAQLTAKVAHEQNARVYKVYNNSGSRQVHFEVPSERSVLRYAFPETVIFNDRSFTGKLLRNRTFWTMRLTGHASSCPGFFVVRLTDQDRPDVDVYHYDIAITTEDCSFTVEFHLPSGGDTNFINKQFVVRLTDSRKTMKLILVSPQRIPEFEIPDFDDDFDLKKLEVLIPFGGAAGGMFIVLIAILIYGYKTRPKDSYHRDRDNELHFRHILYVVWFVGMRLVKSFLLTLTVLSVILTAIHYTNVKTLDKYETLQEQRSKLEEEFIKEMDTHKVQEINRQWSLLGEGKQVCDLKLKALNAFLEEHFKGMIERQLEEMRRKSIILAAGRRIKKQFNATRAKFERERKRLNEQLEAYSNEINSRISQIQRKIDGSFWLQAAKGLYNFLDGLASIFGSGIEKPFIEWVGLSVNFPSINVNLPSFDDIFGDFNSDSLNFQKFELSETFSIWQGNPLKDIKINIQQISFPNFNISRLLSKDRAEELLALEWIVQLYKSGVFTAILIILDLLWFAYRHSKTYQLALVLIHGFPKVYELEEIQNKEEKKEEKKKKKEEKLKKKLKKKPRKKKDEDKDDGEDLEEANEEHRENYEGNGKETMEDTKEISGHTENATSRVKPKPHANEPGIASAGKNAPNISVDSAQDQESGHIKRVDNSDDETKSDESKSRKVIGHGMKGLDRLNAIFAKFLIKIKQLNYQINNTNLVPMCILSVIGILSIYLVIVTTKHSMNVETLDVVGYFDLKLSPLLTMRKIVNTRITSNAFMVNDVHIPYYENRVNARIGYYRKKAKMYQAYQCSKGDLHNEEYCSWAEEPGTSCEGVGLYNQAFLGNLTQFECNLEPVIAQRFTKFDRIRYKEVYKRAIAPYVAALRGLILNTFYMILVVIGIFIFFQILGILVFVLMKKFDLVRQVKHYQSNHDLKKELTLPHCIKYPSNESIVRRAGPLEMSEDMKDKFGPSVHDGKSIEWVK